MNFFKKLFSSPPPSSSKKYYIFHVKCRRCGEVIEGRVDLEHNLSVEYEEGGEFFYCRKVLMGDGKNMCYQKFEVGLKFDAKRGLLEKRIEGPADFVEA